MLDIYTIPVGSEILLYSPLRQVTALVNRRAAALVREQFQNPKDFRSFPDALKELFWTLHQPVQPAEPVRRGSVRPIFLGLLPTRACNLACVYCDFGAAEAPATTMDWQLATTAVDWMAANASARGAHTFEIHFFGGEPFFASDVVDVAVHRARTLADRLGLLPYFEVSTNGVFGETRAQFVGDYFDTVVLSLDGTREFHDRNRPRAHRQGSFDTVVRTAQILSQSQTKLCLRMCVTQESVVHLERIVRWFCKTFRPSIINVEPLQPTPASEAEGLHPPDPYEFAAHYIRAESLIKKEFGLTVVYSSASTDIVRRSFCPLGKDALIVAPNGQVNGCYLPESAWRKRGMDLTVGHLSTTDGMQLDTEAITRLRRMIADKPPRCQECFCRWTCAGGCHVNHSYPGCSTDYDAFCIQTRIITTYALLKKLGFEEKIIAILEDREALAKLALQPADRAVGRYE